MAAGMFYWLVPRLYGTQAPLASAPPNCHFWIGTVGILLYVVVDVGRGRHAGPDVARARTPTARCSTRTSSRRSSRSGRCTGCASSAASLYLAGFVMMAWNLVEDGARRQGRRRHVTEVRRDGRARAGGRGSGLGAGARRPAADLSRCSILGAIDVPRLGVAEVAPFLVGRDDRARRPRRGRRPAATRRRASRRGTRCSRAAAGLHACSRLVAVLVGGVAEIVPTIVIKQAVPAHGDGAAAVHAARARGPRRLRPRGLLQLPLADDPPVRGGDARYGEVSPRRGLHLRPPVPVGEQAHRAGPRARGRQVPEPLALQPHDRSARDEPGSNMPAFPWLAARTIDVEGRAPASSRDAAARRALHRRGHRHRRRARSASRARRSPPTSRRRASTPEAGLASSSRSSPTCSGSAAARRTCRPSQGAGPGREGGAVMWRQFFAGMPFAAPAAVRALAVPRRVRRRLRLALPRAQARPLRGRRAAPAERRRPAADARHAMTDDKPRIHHVYDGIEEHDNQLPRLVARHPLRDDRLRRRLLALLPDLRPRPDPARGVPRARRREIAARAPKAPPSDDETLLALVEGRGDGEGGRAGLHDHLRRVPRPEGGGADRPEPHRRVLAARRQADADLRRRSRAACPTRACPRGARCSARSGCARSTAFVLSQRRQERPREGAAGRAGALARWNRSAPTSPRRPAARDLPRRREGALHHRAPGGVRGAHRRSTSPRRW